MIKQFNVERVGAMTLFGWIFWGAIILFLIISFIFYKKGTKRSEKSLNQLEADEQFRNSSKFPY
ncbi:hypothetical protein [Heyndrickxia sporothermodurans]|uniref:Uncharacterized protein n=2 Tax=Bacillaceae TaxID=186817 RepID=A0A150L8R6_9BACI|nr:hypothetical protein B4102_0735 [Heyndrickxia sporothermodurans]